MAAAMATAAKLNSILPLCSALQTQKRRFSKERKDCSVFQTVLKTSP
jgi:hypothetical protein